MLRCVCAVSWANWLLFTGVSTRCVVSRARRPGRLGSCSPVFLLGALLCVCAVSWATWLLFTRRPARCVVLRVPCPGPPGSCSPVCPLGVVLRVRCPGPLGSCTASGFSSSRDRSRRKKKPRKRRTTRKNKAQNRFFRPQKPPKNFTPLFSEVAKFRTLTEKEEQQSRDGDEVERCLPQNT